MQSLTTNKFDVLDSLTKSDFNLPLTAERLNLTISEVLAQLSPDTEITIINHMKLRMVLEAYNIWKQTLPFFITALANAEPKDVLRAYNTLTETLSQITKQNAQPANGAQINQVVLNMLPPEVRNRVLELLPDDANVINIPPTIQGNPPRTVQDGD